jgi:lipid kinase YegS
MWLRLILNRKAAQDEDLRRAVEVMRARNHRVDVRAMWEGGDGIRMAADAARDGCDVVVACGGDGTINEVVNGLMGAPDPKPALGIVPSGTANDFATMLGIAPGLPLAALDRIVSRIPSRPPRLVDVGRVNTRYFLNVASAGFGAKITADTPSEFKAVLGGVAYLLTGLANMVDLEPEIVNISAPNLTWSGPLLALCVGNGRQAGGGFNVCPDAEIDDGLFDVLVVQDFPLEEMPSVLNDVLRFGLRGEHLPPSVMRFRAPWLEVHASAGLHVNLDGEPIEGRSFRFVILPQALTLLA